MGWLWSSSSSSTSSPQNTSSTPSPPPPPSVESTPEQAPQVPTKPLSRDEVAERELQSFLSELEADVHPSSTKYNRVPRPPPASSPTTKPTANPLSVLSKSQEKSSSATPSDPSSSSSSISEALLPTSMSCRTAFDAAFYCNSFGGRFNDLYRYGGIRSCSEHWNDFWFCMKTKSYGDTLKEEAIRDYYRKKERNKYYVEGKSSSEDVWRSRERMVDEDTAFKEEIVGWGKGGERRAGDEVDDEAWRERERESRRRDKDRF